MYPVMQCDWMTVRQIGFRFYWRIFVYVRKTVWSYIVFVHSSLRVLVNRAFIKNLLIHRAHDDGFIGPHAIYNVLVHIYRSNMALRKTGQRRKIEKTKNSRAFRDRFSKRLLDHLNIVCGVFLLFFLFSFSTCLLSFNPV